MTRALVRVRVRVRVRVSQRQDSLVVTRALVRVRVRVTQDGLVVTRACVMRGRRLKACADGGTATKPRPEVAGQHGQSAGGWLAEAARS